MLKERRIKHVEYRGVKLADPATGSVVPDGSLLVPVGTDGGEATYGIPNNATFDSTSPEMALAKVVFSEPGKYDTLETGKTVVMQGTIEFSTDQFIAADAANMTFGMPLAVKKDTDGFLKFGLVTASADVVVGRVTMAPGDDPEGLLGVAGTFI